MRGYSMSTEPSKGDDTARASKRAFSVHEFSKLYGVGRTTTYEELKAGRLRGRKIGKRTIITKNDAEDWLRRLPATRLPFDQGRDVAVLRSGQQIAFPMTRDRSIFNRCGSLADRH